VVVVPVDGAVEDADHFAALVDLVGVASDALRAEQDGAVQRVELGVGASGTEEQSNQDDGHRTGEEAGRAS
jgi:hypothetical protein